MADTYTTLDNNGAYVRVSSDGNIELVGADLKFNGSSVQTGAGGSAPGGFDTQIQFNDAGELGGSEALTINKTAGKVTLYSPNSNGGTDSVGILATKDLLDNGGTETGVHTTVEAYLLVDGSASYANPLAAIHAHAQHLYDGTVTTLYGVAAEAANQDGGTVTELAAFVAQSGNDDVGTVTDAYQFKANTISNAAGTITRAHGVFIDDQSSAGSTNYALHIASQGAGAADYAIYSAGGRIRLDATPVPNAANAAGLAGEIAWDSGFIYVCVATNTWKRVAISTW